MQTGNSSQLFALVQPSYSEQVAFLRPIMIYPGSHSIVHLVPEFEGSQVQFPFFTSGGILQAGMENKTF